MRKIYALLVFVAVCQLLSAEILRGTITDAFTREPLIGVTILNTDNNTGTVTDENGQYE